MLFTSRNEICISISELAEESMWWEEGKKYLFISIVIGI